VAWQSQPESSRGWFAQKRYRHEPPPSLWCRGLSYYASQFLLYLYESAASLLAFGIYPAAISAAIMAVNVSAVITLNMSKNIDTKIISEPMVLRQCFTITSSIRLGLVGLLLICEYTPKPYPRLGNVGLKITK
jgi:hypothetical protein